mgnify:FL=1
MKLSPFERISLIYLVRSFARVISVALLLFIAMVAIGEGFPNPMELSGRESLLTVFFVAMVAGLIVGWWRELAGGLLVLGGFAAFMLVELIATGDAGMNWIFALFPVAGMLYILFWRLGRPRRRPQAPRGGAREKGEGS